MSSMIDIYLDAFGDFDIPSFKFNGFRIAAGVAAVFGRPKKIGFERELIERLDYFRETRGVVEIRGGYSTDLRKLIEIVREKERYDDENWYYDDSSLYENGHFKRWYSCIRMNGEDYILVDLDKLVGYLRQLEIDVVSATGVTLYLDERKGVDVHASVFLGMNGKFPMGLKAIKLKVGKGSMLNFERKGNMWHVWMDMAGKVESEVLNSVENDFEVFSVLYEFDCVGEREIRLPEGVKVRLFNLNFSVRKK